MNPVKKIMIGASIAVIATAGYINLLNTIKKEEPSTSPIFYDVGEITGDNKKDLVYLKDSKIYKLEEKLDARPVPLFGGPGLENVCGLFLNDFNKDGLDDITLFLDDKGIIAVRTYANFGEEGFFFDPNGLHYDPFGNIKKSIYLYKTN
ncbi:hypothetical protein HOA59_00300 [archaeon]|nr:hypothetical protein [archaeon]MBT6823862.1 hypothetical protein [archaeon]MBT7107393.1 hypothetical protein [archaeon]MBT7297213.1 hypothetical protein [archaeon]